MPIYEYECPKCQKIAELLVKISDKKSPRCEGCGAAMKRLISKTSFSLKGDGWYKDGYSSSKAKTPVSKTSASGTPASKTPAPVTSGESSKTKSSQKD